LKVLTTHDDASPPFSHPATGFECCYVTREYRIFGLLVWRRTFTIIDIETQVTW
jgi:hypothetical protein